MCGKENGAFKYECCSQDFCYNDFNSHRQELSKQLEELEITHDSFQRTAEPPKHLLIEKMNDWKRDLIHQIRQTTEETRQLLFKHAAGHFDDIEIKLSKLANRRRQSRQENEFTETDSPFKKQFAEPSNITFRQSSTPFINKIHVAESFGQLHSFININLGSQWTQSKLNQLSYPHSIYADDDQTIYIDFMHDRVASQKCGATSGQVVAGGNGQGNGIDLFNDPTDVIVDKKNDSIIICDQGNRQAMLWTHPYGTIRLITISDIDNWSQKIDNNGYLYVTDAKKHKVKQKKMGDLNGKGNQLDCPVYCNYFIFIISIQSNILTIERN